MPPVVRYRLLATNASAVLAGRIVSIACGFVLATALFRTLGARRYGLWSLLTLLASYSTVIDFGLAAAVERRTATLIAEGREDAIASLVSTTVMGLILIAFVGELVASLVVFNFDDWARANSLTRALLVLPSCTALTLMSLAIGAVLAGFQQMRSLYLFRSIGVLFGTVAVLIAILREITALDLLLVIYTTGSVVTLLFVLRRVRRLLPAAVMRVTWDAEAIRDLLAFGSIVQLATMIPPAAEYAFRIIVSARFGFAFAGIYDLGSRAAVAPRSIAGALFSAMVPFAVQTDRHLGRQGLSRLIRSTARHTALFILPVSAILYGFSAHIIRAWLGDGIAAGEVRACFEVVLIAHAVGALWVPASMAGRALGMPGPEAVMTFLSFGTALFVAQVAPTFVIAAGALWGIPAIGGFLTWIWLARMIDVRRPELADMLLSGTVALVGYGTARVVALYATEQMSVIIGFLVVTMLTMALAFTVELRNADRRAALHGFLSSLLKT